MVRARQQTGELFRIIQLVVYYAGDLTGTGGWYNLEVRGMNGDQQVGNTTTIERVGIGEVFIVAGQSNAQGIHQNAPNPLNDRVNCVNYQYPGRWFSEWSANTCFYVNLTIRRGFTISPRGTGSWCWGQLGDILVKRLNVPVMFFNAAYTGTACSKLASKCSRRRYSLWRV